MLQSYFIMFGLYCISQLMRATGVRCKLAMRQLQSLGWRKKMRTGKCNHGCWWHQICQKIDMHERTHIVRHSGYMFLASLPFINVPRHAKFCGFLSVLRTCSCPKAIKLGAISPISAGQGFIRPAKNFCLRQLIAEIRPNQNKCLHQELADWVSNLSIL